MTARLETPYFNTVEAAEYLRLKPGTLQTWRSQGGGPPFRQVGRRVLYLKSELDAFVEAGRSGQDVSSQDVQG